MVDKMVDKMNDEGSKAETLGNLAKALADLGVMEQTYLLLDKAVRFTENISDEKMKSATYGINATTYAQLKQYRLARKTAGKAKFAGDTLNGYMAVLKFYTIEKHPELAEKLAKLEKEDKR